MERDVCADSAWPFVRSACSASGRGGAPGARIRYVRACGACACACGRRIPRCADAMPGTRRVRGSQQLSLLRFFHHRTFNPEVRPARAERPRPLSGSTGRLTLREMPRATHWGDDARRSRVVRLGMPWATRTARAYSTCPDVLAVCWPRLAPPPPPHSPCIRSAGFRNPGAGSSSPTPTGDGGDGCDPTGATTLAPCRLGCSRLGCTVCMSYTMCDDGVAGAMGEGGALCRGCSRSARPRAFCCIMMLRTCSPPHACGLLCLAANRGWRDAGLTVAGSTSGELL